jgi:hypothetical protein
MKKKPKRAGRPTLLNATLSRKLCALLAEAHPIKASCEACGVSEASYHTWISRGEAGEKPFSEFLASTTRARAQARIRLVKEIKRCSHNDWRGWAWIAERMFPQEFGRTAERLLLGEDPKQTQPIINVIIRESEETRKAERLAGDAKPNGRV